MPQSEGYGGLKFCASVFVQGKPATERLVHKGAGAESEEKREPVSDIDTEVVDSLKALDPRRPIREADIQSARSTCYSRRQLFANAAIAASRPRLGSRE